MVEFWACTQSHEKRPLASSCFCVRLPFHMEQFGSHLSDFHGVIHLGDFIKYVEKIHIPIRLDKITKYPEDQRKFLSALVTNFTE